MAWLITIIRASEEKGCRSRAGQRKDTASQLPANQQEGCTSRKGQKNSSDSYLPRQTDRTSWHLVMPNGKWKPRKQKWAWSDLRWSLIQSHFWGEKWFASLCALMIRLSCQVEMPWREKTGPRAAVIVRIKGSSSGFCSEVIASITSKSFSKQLRVIYTLQLTLKTMHRSTYSRLYFQSFLCIHGFNQPHTVVFTGWKISS